MGGELACALRNYIIAETPFEKEFFLSRIYITKDSALEHFYGLNNDQKEKSLWTSIRAMIPEDDKVLMMESSEFNDKFESICKKEPERNILAHVNNVPTILSTLDDINPSLTPYWPFLLLFSTLRSSFAELCTTNFS